MRIYFCDLCNESVPQIDLDRGTAVLRKGRVICAPCESAMTGESDVGQPLGPDEPVAAAAPEPARVVVPRVGDETTMVDTRAFVPPRPEVGSTSSTGAAVGVALASVALILAVSASAFLYDQIEGRNQELLQSLEQDRLDAADRESRFQARLDALLREAAADGSNSRVRVSELETRIDELTTHQREVIGTLREDLYRLVEKTGELDALMAAVDQHDRQLAEVVESAASLHDQVSRVGVRLETVEETGGPALTSAPVPADEAPEWLSMVGNLSSQNSGTRWQAVQSLGATRDPAVAEHLTAMLRDPDIFVRMATARILGDLEAVIGVPALIDALEDPEASVREAAVVSLRSITGRDFRFDPGGRQAERSRRVKAWRDWWKKASRDLLPENA